MPTRSVALLKLFDGWVELIMALLRQSDPVFQPWPLYNYPSRQSWRPAPGAYAAK
jgi:hypothetical protein